MKDGVDKIDLSETSATTREEIAMVLAIEWHKDLAVFYHTVMAYNSIANRLIEMGFNIDFVKKVEKRISVSIGNRPIKDARLGKRIENALARLKDVKWGDGTKYGSIDTIGDLSRVDMKHMRWMKGIGGSAIGKIVRALNRLGFKAIDSTFSTDVSKERPNTMATLPEDDLDHRVHPEEVGGVGHDQNNPDGDHDGPRVP